MIILLAVSGGLYLFVIGIFFYGWLSFDKKALQLSVKYSISILIPVHNGQKTLPFLLDDIRNQSYSHDKFEVIVIDDHSTDQTVQLLDQSEYPFVKLISLPEGSTGKKQALLAGLTKASGEIIVTTDADCRVGNQWLEEISNGFSQGNPVLVMAPVIGLPSSNWFEQCQQLEMFSLLGSTAGSAHIGKPVMCNGANLAFRKEVINEVQKVYHESPTESGDDIFTLLAIKKKYRNRIYFLKSLEATVKTELSRNFSDFIRQRRRWTSKAWHYIDFDIIFTGGVVFLMNLSLIILMVYGIYSSKFNLFLYLLAIKSVIDFPFLWSVASFYKNKNLLKWFPLVQGLYFFYVCITVFGGLFITPKWKHPNH